MIKVATLSLAYNRDDSDSESIPVKGSIEISKIMSSGDLESIESKPGEEVGYSSPKW